jgi:hypothetical protein
VSARSVVTALRHMTPSVVAVLPLLWRRYHCRGGATAVVAVLPSSWQYYRRRGSNSAVVAVLPPSLQYCRRRGGATAVVAVLPPSLQYYRRRGGTTAVVAALPLFPGGFKYDACFSGRKEMRVNRFRYQTTRCYNPE